MSLNPKWTPMRWRCGPLGGGGAAVSSTRSRWGLAVDPWTDPAMLDLLDGTPINCLVVDWAAGGKSDETQQWLLMPLIEAGRRKGISFVGRVTAKDGLPAIASAGQAAGLEALLLPGPVSESLALPAIALFSRDSIDWDHLTDTFTVNDIPWPGAAMPSFEMPAPSNAQSASAPSEPAGPTMAPWVDSNGWVSLLARSLAPDKTLWLDFGPGDAAKSQPTEQYCLAVADARASGCRWMIDLDEPMRAALAAHAPAATAAWKQIAAMEAFFNEHPQWAQVDSVGVLTVISDFRSNPSMSNEVLNLLQRQHVPFVVADRGRPLDSRIAGKRAVLWVDDPDPTPEQEALLIKFVEQGGLLIAPKYWGPKGISSHQEDWLFGYDVYPVGKGRIVVANGGYTDPFQLDRDTHILVGHENDPFRLYNSGTTNCYIGSEPTGRKEIVHVLNYSAPRAADYITVWVHHTASAATLWSAADSKPLKCSPEDGGTSFNLPPVTVYYAVEIERQA